MEALSINNSPYVAAKAQQTSSYSSPAAESYPVYAEESSESSGSSLALIGLGILGAAGIGYGIYKHRKVSGLNDEITKLTKKADESAKKLSETEEKLNNKIKELDTANEELNKLKGIKPEDTPAEAKLSLWQRFKNLFKRNA